MTEFEALRPRLFGIAYRILGVVADAEDVVQETWIAWDSADRVAVQSPAAYLTRAVTNRALNRLRELARRKEEYIGPWLPEPIDTGARPEDAAELAESVSYALMVLLEQLTPLERTAFVLRDVFDVPTAEVAQTLSSTPAAVRQLVSRARGHLAERDRSYEVDPHEHRRVAAEFLSALGAADVNRAAGLLTEDVELVADGGGVIKAALRPIHGQDKVVRLLFSLTEHHDYRLRAVDINGMPGTVFHTGEDGSRSVVQVGVVGGRIAAIWVVRNPAKLTRFAPPPPGGPPPAGTGSDSPDDRSRNGPDQAAPPGRP